MQQTIIKLNKQKGVKHFKSCNSQSQYNVSRITQYKNVAIPLHIIESSTQNNRSQNIMQLQFHKPIYNSSTQYSFTNHFNRKQMKGI